MTKELDRRFRHVGRIKRAWGTTHKPTIKAMEQMLDGLFQRGRLDILKMIQDKTYTKVVELVPHTTPNIARRFHDSIPELGISSPLDLLYGNPALVFAGRWTL